MWHAGNQREEIAGGAASDRFVTTRWSIVTAAGGRSSGARRAMASLCQAYWFPLYAYVRRRGYAVEDAQDLTQSFFAKLLASETIAKSDPHRGRFRSFLLSSLKNFLADEWDKAHAAKRGGGARATRPLMPGGVDPATAEAWYGREPATDITPEKLFDRRWALTLLGTVLETLRKRYEADGKAGLFERLKPFIGGGNDGNSVPSSGIATELGMTDGAVKVAIHRLRRRYRECLRSAIADTVESEADIDDEIRDLFAAVGR